MIKIVHAHRILTNQVGHKYKSRMNEDKQGVTRHNLVVCYSIGMIILI